MFLEQDNYILFYLQIIHAFISNHHEPSDKDIIIMIMFMFIYRAHNRIIEMLYALYGYITVFNEVSNWVLQIVTSDIGLDQYCDTIGIFFNVDM